MAKWQTARNASGEANILCMGTSNVYAWGPTGIARSEVDSWPFVLQKSLGAMRWLEPTNKFSVNGLGGGYQRTYMRSDVNPDGKAPLNSTANEWYYNPNSFTYIAGQGCLTAQPGSIGEWTYTSDSPCDRFEVLIRDRSQFSIKVKVDGNPVADIVSKGDAGTSVHVIPITNPGAASHTLTLGEVTGTANADVLAVGGKALGKKNLANWGIPGSNLLSSGEAAWMSKGSAFNSLDQLKKIGHTDLVIVQIGGGNDVRAGLTPAQVQAELETLYGYITTNMNAPTIMAVSPIGIDQQGNDLRAAQLAAAANHGVVSADWDAALMAATAPSGQTGEATTDAAGVRSSWSTDADNHIGKEGHKVLADTINACLSYTYA
jgi:lysophospholipase L1-like esterase